MEPTLPHSDLRPFQRAALDALARGVRHLAVSAPTGSGKSLIYERACRSYAQRSVLITPLQALGIQQSLRLEKPTGTDTRPVQVALGLAVHSRERRGPPRVQWGESGIWIVSPEMLQSPAWWERLVRYRPELWIIDEAHCVWEWGSDFRPAYAALLQHPLSQAILSARSLWLSATFPAHGLRELQLRFGEELTIQGAFQLPDHIRLIWEKVDDAQRIARLLHWLELLGRDPGVIFVSSRMAAVRVGRLLDAAGMPNTVYHAGFSPEIRRALERRLCDARAQILIATSAFGLGMDFAHLRWGIFWELPYGVLDLAQRIGRVGRSRTHPTPPATTVALWSEKQLQERGDPALARVMASERCRRQLFAEIFEAPYVRASTGGCCDFCLRTIST